jgi:hypothetical protein
MPFIVTPGYTFVDGEVFTATKANLAANPTVTGTGTMLFLNGDNTTGAGNLAQETFGYNNTQTYLHFVQTRHQGATGGTGNAWVLWLNNSVGATASTQPFTGNIKVVDASIGGVAILGTTTADSAATGFVGEYMTGSTGFTTLTSGTATTVASTNIGAGDWDVWSVFVVNPSGTTTGIMQGGTTATTNVLPATGSEGYCAVNSPITGNLTSMNTLPVRFSTTAATTAYAVGYVTFTGGTCTISAFIRARRVR